MEPKNFKESTSVLTAPGSMPDCGDLPVYKDGKQCVSCWHASLKERITILFTGCAWMGVRGVAQPPVWLSGRCPFVRPNIFDRIRGLWADLTDVVHEVGRFIKDLAKALKNEPDKCRHVVAGFDIAIIVGVMFGPWWGFAAGVVAGALKEAWDQITRKGTPEWFDFIATTLGTISGSVLVGILYAIM